MTAISSNTGRALRSFSYLVASASMVFARAVRLPISLPSAGAPGVPQKPTSRCAGKISRPPRGSSERGAAGGAGGSADGGAGVGVMDATDSEGGVADFGSTTAADAGTDGAGEAAAE